MFLPLNTTQANNFVFVDLMDRKTFLSYFFTTVTILLVLLVI